MNLHVTASHDAPVYLSRNKARDIFGGYNSLPIPVRSKIVSLFEEEREPYKGVFYSQTALIFNRMGKRKYHILLKLEGRFGHFTVTDGPPTSCRILALEEFVSDEWQEVDIPVA